MLKMTDRIRLAGKCINYYIKDNGCCEESAMSFEMSNVLYVKKFDLFIIVINGKENNIQIRFNETQVPIVIESGIIKVNDFTIQFIPSDNMSFLIVCQLGVDSKSLNEFGALFGTGTIHKHNKKSLGYMMEAVENK